MMRPLPLIYGVLFFMGKRLVFNVGDDVGCGHKYISEAERYSKYRRRVNVSCCYCDSKFSASLNDIRSGDVMSCGCMGVEKHGMSGSKLYVNWNATKRRCTEDTNRYFKYYGGRGIGMADEFLNSFKSWYDYITSLDGYDERNLGNNGLTIDRIDNNKGYERGNLRWVDKSFQSANQRKKSKNKYIGVYKRGKKYYYSVVYRGEEVSEFGFGNEEDAAIARNEFLRKSGWPNTRCII